MALRVGYIGLGAMGYPIARNILRAGFALIVFNRTKGKCDALAAEGAQVGDSPAQVAAQCDVVFTNVTDGRAVMDLLFTPSTGIAATIRPGSIFVDNSTIKPMEAREIHKRLAEKNVEALDAPVSGGDIGARNGTLSIMVGGSAEVLERVTPIMNAMGKSIIHVGGPGAGQVCKAANQIMTAAQMVAMGELLVFSAKCGVDPEKVVQAVKGGAAQCWTLDVKPPRIFAGNRSPGFKAALQSKDLQIVMESAKEFNVALPTTAVNAHLYQSMLARNEGDLDNSAVLNVLEAMSCTRIGPQA